MRAPILLLLLLLPAAASAVDTWEPYPLGARTVEGYVTLYGFEDRDGAYAFFGPSWGLDDRTHVSLYVGLLHPAEGQPYSGGLDLLSLVLFRNLHSSGPLSLDAYAQVEALGTGLEASGHAYGLEINLDLSDLGFYCRPSQRTTSFLDNGSISQERRQNHFAWGLWMDALRGTQLLLEYTDGNAEMNNDQSWAAGLNHLWSDTLELIGEWRYWPGPEDADAAFWDITLGFVAVW